LNFVATLFESGDSILLIHKNAPALPFGKRQSNEQMATDNGRAPVGFWSPHQDSFSEKKGWLPEILFPS
jgi:hypothetical protein